MQLNPDNVRYSVAYAKHLQFMRLFLGNNKKLHANYILGKALPDVIESTAITDLSVKMGYISKFTMIIFCNPICSGIISSHNF